MRRYALMHTLNTLLSFVAFTAATTTVLSRSSNDSSTYPDCVELVFSLPVSSRGTVDPTSPFPITFAINKTFEINGRYCIPHVPVNGTADILQVLVHGITYNRNYWSGLDFPGFHGTNYSWISYAAGLGYPTLSIDRLGHGLSDHPDPISINQNQPQIDLMHELVEQIRTGSVLPRNYQRIVYVGHSQGSLIGKAYTDQYPLDVDAVVLTGWTTMPPNGSIVFPGLAVASQVATRFTDLEPGYLAPVNAAARAPFYSVPGLDYDPDFLQYDFARDDVYALGTAFTTPNQTIQSSFAGPVFVLTGQLDRVFCGPTGDCGPSNASFLASESQYFPRASSFGYFSPAATGHDLNFHYTQVQSFAAAHDYLEQTGYGRPQ